MTPPRKPSTSKQQTAPGRADARQEGKDLQPPATGAKGGSPAARVMKQFAKTRTESSGRS
jgi:hypothetical protein